MAEAALRYAGGSHRLWLVAAHQRANWQDRAALLQRGILALSAAASPAAPPAAESPRSGPLTTGSTPDHSAGAASKLAPGLTWAAAAAPPGAGSTSAAAGRDTLIPCRVEAQAAGQPAPSGSAAAASGCNPVPCRLSAELGGARLRAEQALDLGLRLMHLLGGACRNGALAAWAAALAVHADACAGRPSPAAAADGALHAHLDNCLQTMFLCLQGLTVGSHALETQTGARRVGGCAGRQRRRPARQPGCCCAHFSLTAFSAKSSTIYR